MTRTFLLAALALLIAGTAAAQQAPTGPGPESDIKRERQRLGPETPPEPGTPPKDFEIALTAPVLLTDNAVREDVVGNATQRGDAHFNPDLFLKWSHQFANFRLATSVDASVDRYFTETDLDLDTAFGSVALALTDGRSDLFVPYVSYAVTADFVPDFSQWEDVLHSFSAGFGSAIAFDAGGRPIRLQDALNPGDRSFAVDVSAGRRLSDPHDFENSFVLVSADLFYVAASEWTFGFSPRFRARWFDDFFGDFRRDFLLSGLVRAIWTPSWLTSLVPGAEIDATLSFTRNFSTLQSEDFSQWEGGPALVFDWKF